MSLWANMYSFARVALKMPWWVKLVGTRRKTNAQKINLRHAFLCCCIFFNHLLYRSFADIFIPCMHGLMQEISVLCARSGKIHPVYLWINHSLLTDSKIHFSFINPSHTANFVVPSFVHHLNFLLFSGNNTSHDGKCHRITKSTWTENSLHWRHDWCRESPSCESFDFNLIIVVVVSHKIDKNWEKTMLRIRSCLKMLAMKIIINIKV